MTHNDGDRPRLDPEDARFVQRIGELYRRPELGAAERARFDARLDERITRVRGPAWRALAALAAGAAAFFLIARLQLPATPLPQVEESGEVAPAGGALLALLEDEPIEAGEALPDDYAALASLLE